jgi:hypothetical protein
MFKDVAVEKLLLLILSGEHPHQPVKCETDVAAHAYCRTLIPTVVEPINSVRTLLILEEHTAMTLKEHTAMTLDENTAITLVTAHHKL